MIRAVGFENFKSYRQARLPIGSLTVLIGANASGKSNAIEALRFLQAISTGRYLDNVYRELHAEGVLRGRRRELVWELEDEFALSVTVESELGDQMTQMEWRVRIRVVPELVVVEERLECEHEAIPTFWSEEREGDSPHSLAVRYNNFARGGRKPLIWTDDRQAVFTSLNPSLFSTEKARSYIEKRLKALSKTLQNIYFLEPRPALMRGYAPLDEEVRLDVDGRNLSAVLYDLCENKGKRQQVLDFIRQLPEGEIADLDFIVTSRQDIMVRLGEQFGPKQQEWDAAILSDGTLRVLAVTAALLSVPEGSLLVIEEIDNGVHPSRTHVLVDKMLAVIRERHLNVLVTTHNPTLLDVLPSELYPNVVYCFRDLNQADSRLIRLVEMQDYPAFMVEGSLGSLLHRRVLEQIAHKDVPSLEDRKSRSLEWLKKWFDVEDASH